MSASDDEAGPGADEAGADSSPQLEAAQVRLLRAEKMASLGMLIAGIAHEINTPIGAVRSMNETSARALVKLREALAQELPDYEQRGKIGRFLKMLEETNQVAAEGSQRIVDIVRRVRSFARLDQTDLQSVRLEEGLEDTLKLIHHELKHGVTVHRDFEPLPAVACYPGRLNQVFLNLLMNARQAMRKGEIFIRTFSTDDMACVSIRDTGSGIDPDHLERIFETGFTTKGDGVGTGLGLSIVRSIVDEHRGTIGVSSARGVGTTFTVRIPLDLAEVLDAEDEDGDFDPSAVAEPAED